MRNYKLRIFLARLILYYIKALSDNNLRRGAINDQQRLRQSMEFATTPFNQIMPGIMLKSLISVLKVTTDSSDTLLGNATSNCISRDKIVNIGYIWRETLKKKFWKI